MLPMKRIAFQGMHGAFSEAAAYKYFGRKIKTLECNTFSDIFEAVEDDAEYGVLPVENSVEGSVSQAYDLLLERNLHVVGEVILRIEHCLIANEGVSINNIKKVYSHPQALGQSRQYIEKLGVEAIPFGDTAGSVKMLKEARLMDSGAIASEYAAKLYGMHILRRNIENNKENYTRFFILSKRALKSGNKISIAFVTRHIPGALHMALGCFAAEDINMTYIQSRPIPGKPWEYRFYIDCEGYLKSAKMQNAINRLRNLSLLVKILGTYRMAKTIT